MKRTLRTLLLLSVTAVMASTAQAAPVTYNFSGTKIAGSEYNLSLGNTIVGTLTLDPDQAADYIKEWYDWEFGYVAGQYGMWSNGGFTINAITDSGYVTGTTPGVGTTYYNNYDLPNYRDGPFSEDYITWYDNSGTSDSYRNRLIAVYSFSYNNLDGDGIAEVSDPWEPLADEYYFVDVFDQTYYVTGEYIFASASYQLDSFESGPPPDTTPPTFTSLTPSSAVLWPPNHQMVPITLTAVTSDNVGVVSTKIISVSSSEPDNGLGDGDTAGDFQITGDLTVSLRAERSGKGNGRTYTITAEAADAAGNKTQKTTTVFVPKSQSKKK